MSPVLSIVESDNWIFYVSFPLLVVIVKMPPFKLDVLKSVVVLVLIATAPLFIVVFPLLQLATRTRPSDKDVPIMSIWLLRLEGTMVVDWLLARVVLTSVKLDRPLPLLWSMAILVAIPALVATPSVDVLPGILFRLTAAMWLFEHRRMDRLVVLIYVVASDFELVVHMASAVPLFLVMVGKMSLPDVLLVVVVQLDFPGPSFLASTMCIDVDIGARWSEIAIHSFPRLSVVVERSSMDLVPVVMASASFADNVSVLDRLAFYI